MRLDASEADPDAAATADLPGHGAAARTAQEEGPAGPTTAAGPRQQPHVGPPAQDRPDPRGAR